MTRVWFVIPCHGRVALTRVCLRQLRRTCDALAPDIHATAVVVADDENLATAHELGFATVRRDNQALGRKWNDGYQLACDPNLPERRAPWRHPNLDLDPADYVVPCGSDDWVDPIIFRKLPPPDRIGVFQRIAVVNEDRTRLTPIRYQGMAGGVGIRIIPRQLLERCGYRPAEEDRKRAIDASTHVGITRTVGRPRLEVLDVHPFQIVDWKSHREQLNSYAMLRGYRRGEETEDVWGALAEHYPAGAIEEMRAL